MNYNLEKENNRNQHLIMMARMFSHNLRSPIAGLKMLFPLYEMEKDPKGKEDIFENIKLGASEMFEMIEDLSQILMDYRELEKPKEELSLQNTLDKTLELINESLPSNTQIIADFEDCKTVLYSQKYLDFAFKELLQNSIRFRSPHRDLILKITSKKIGEKSILSFADNGPGIDLDLHQIDLYKMYKTFHGSESIRNRGLGIFSLKNQLEMMGGKLKLEGEKEGGFSVNLEFLP